MKVVAIMPIKLNNERLPGKNTMILGDKPLLCYELDNLLSVDKIELVYVFCSDESIRDYIPQGVRFLKRDSHLDEPISNFNQIMDSFINQVDADIYIYAHATAPYITLETMKLCLEKVMSGECDSAFCAVKIQDFLWKDGKPLNFDRNNLPRSQDLEPIYRETSGIYVFTKKMYEERHCRIGEHPYICEVGFRESIDINNKEDFELAKKYL